MYTRRYIVEIKGSQFVILFSDFIKMSLFKRFKCNDLRGADSKFFVCLSILLYLIRNDLISDTIM